LKNLNFISVIVVTIFSACYLLYSAYKWLEHEKVREFIQKFPNVKLNIRKASGAFILSKIILYFLIILFLSLALFNPAMGKEKVEENTTLFGVDIVFIIDVSLSMYTIDTPPNRLEKVKEVLLRILPDLNGNRMGIITFAGAPFLYCPMTSDLGAFADYVRGLEPDMIPDSGTELEAALEKAGKILKSDRIYKNKLVVLITDGESRNQNVPSLSGVELLVWGVGTTKGGNIFYKDEASNISGYVTQEKKLHPYPNEPGLVVSKLDESYLRKIASKNQGVYTNITENPILIDKLTEKIQSMEKNANKVLKDLVRKDGYQYFLSVAIFLLLIDLLVLELIFHKRFA
jgi:Ca-activated chloride channel family protein